MASMVLQPNQGSFFKAKRVFKKRGVNGFPIGPRTERRAKENRQLNKLKIKHCEVQIAPECAGHHLLTWAHSKKSRYLVTSKDWQEAARCCLPCHRVIEAMSHAEMKQLVVAAIKRRSVS